MDYALSLILKNCNQNVICIVDDTEKLYVSGIEAANELRKEVNKKYSLVGISAKNSTIVLMIKDISKEIESQNEEFIKDYKRRFGYEPSFF